MRDIRFRAWDDEAKEIFTPHFINQDGLAVGRNEKLGINLYSRKIIEFIGLKDKRNNPIFEGHIVKHISIINGVWIDNILEIYSVIYQGASFQYKPNKNVAWTVDPIGCEVEIIGNIYENPELLKEV